MVTTLDLLELEAALQESENIQKNILSSRDYFHGVQEVYLTARQMDYLGLHGDDNTFRLNVCRTIVTTLSNELNLIGFRTNEQGEKKPVAEWLQGVYQKNKLTSLQDTVHESALSDSETFTIVEWEPEDAYPRILHNIRWTGDLPDDPLQYGVVAVYENNDPNQRMLFAAKQWYESASNIRGTLTTIKRRTVYYPDRIERYIWEGGAWRPFTEEGEEFPLPWVDGAGKPLGIPVEHFKNKGLRSEHWDAIPMQDAINKTLVDILAAEDLTGFKSFFGFNIPPTTDGKEPAADGSNIRKIGPGQLNTTSRLPSEASLQVIEGSDMTPMVNTLTQLILYTAQMTDTPASRFIATAAIASAETLKEQDKQLRRKAQDRRGLFGDAWVSVMDMCRKIENMNNPSALLDESVEIIPIWETSESLDEIERKRTVLGIPQEQAWLEAGYSDEAIAKMKQAPDYKLQFEKALWEGATSATQNIPLETYLRRAGVPDKEIKEIQDAIANQSGLPLTGL
jgi:hypothetical protein